MTSKNDPKASQAETQTQTKRKRMDISDTLCRINQDLSVFTDQELQLNLDLLASTDSENEGLSGILIYDLAPKWVTYQKVLDVTSEAEYTRYFKVLGHPFSVTVKAARIRRQGDKEDKLVFPGQSEQIIDDTLRWMSTHGHGQLKDSAIGAHFSMGNLQSVLKSANHMMSYKEIYESLQVLHYSNLRIRDEVSGHEWSGTFLPTYQNIGADVDVNGDVYRRHWRVTFHDLVNKAMLSTETRMIYWHTLMSMKNNLAKYIYRRISLVYLQASAGDPYTISLSEIMGGFGKPLEPGKVLSNPMRDMDRAMKVLAELDVIDEEKTQIKKKKKGRRAYDAIYTFFPGKMFINQAIEANEANKLVKTSFTRLENQRRVQSIMKNLT